MSTEKKQAELIKEISGVNPLKCMKCGKCSASCPSFNEMDIKPHHSPPSAGTNSWLSMTFSASSHFPARQQALACSST